MLGLPIVRDQQLLRLYVQISHEPNVHGGDQPARASFGLSQFGLYPVHPVDAIEEEDQYENESNLHCQRFVTGVSVSAIPS